MRMRERMPTPRATRTEKHVIVVAAGALAVVLAVFACGETEETAAEDGTDASVDGRTVAEAGTRPDAPSDGGTASDARVQDVQDAKAPKDVWIPDATYPADGGGFCCLMDRVPCSGGFRGGWADDAAACEYSNSADGRFVYEIDDAGCLRWKDVTGVSSITDVDYCCGCFPPGGG